MSVWPSRIFTGKDSDQKKVVPGLSLGSSNISIGSKESLLESQEFLAGSYESQVFDRRESWVSVTSNRSAIIHTPLSM